MLADVLVRSVEEESEEDVVGEEDDPRRMSTVRARIRAPCPKLQEGDDAMKDQDGGNERTVKNVE